MDENTHLLERPTVSRSSNYSKDIRKRFIAPFTIIAVVVLYVFFGRQGKHVLTSNITTNSNSTIISDKVSIELFVMSRCPDAVKVEDMFAKVVPEVYPIMDMQLNFIATLNPDAPLGARCKHGDAECQGNIDELCALRHKPDLPTFWRFLTCMNQHLDDIGRDADLSLECASHAGLDTAAFLTCVAEDEGRKLFKQSVERATFAGITTSATVFIDGKLRCVEDSGWRDCPGGHAADDFIRDICKTYRRRGGSSKTPPPSICSQYSS